VLAAFLLKGLNPQQIAETYSLPERDIRRLLPTDANLFLEKLVAAGCESFDAFVQQNHLDAIKTQASKLGVTRGRLARAYSAYRHLVAQV